MTGKTYLMRNQNIQAKHFEFSKYAQHSKNTTDVVIQQIQKVDRLDRKQVLHQQKHCDKQCIPLPVT